MISLSSLVQPFDFLASVAALVCLILDHRLWPDIPAPSAVSWRSIEAYHAARCHARQRVDYAEARASARPVAVVVRRRSRSRAASGRRCRCRDRHDAGGDRRPRARRAHGAAGARVRGDARDRPPRRARRRRAHRRLPARQRRRRRHRLGARARVRLRRVGRQHHRRRAGRRTRRARPGLRLSRRHVSAAADLRARRGRRARRAAAVVRGARPRLRRRDARHRDRVRARARLARAAHHVDADQRGQDARSTSSPSATPSIGGARSASCRRRGSTRRGASPSTPAASPGFGDDAAYAYAVAEGPLDARNDWEWTDFNAQVVDLPPGASVKVTRWLVVGSPTRHVAVRVAGDAAQGALGRAVRTHPRGGDRRAARRRARLLRRSRRAGGDDALDGGGLRRARCRAGDYRVRAEGIGRAGPAELDVTVGERDRRVARRHHVAQGHARLSRAGERRAACRRG